MQLIKARYAEKTVLHGPLMKSILYASTSANPRDDSGTKRDVYKRQVLGRAGQERPSAMATTVKVLWTTLPVSYTHLDVYKRQLWT